MEMACDGIGVFIGQGNWGLSPNGSIPLILDSGTVPVQILRVLRGLSPMSSKRDNVSVEFPD